MPNKCNCFIVPQHYESVVCKQYCSAEVFSVFSVGRSVVSEPQVSDCLALKIERFFAQLGVTVKLNFDTSYAPHVFLPIPPVGWGRVRMLAHDAINVPFSRDMPGSD
jgi:hypothetical protein